MAWFFYDIFLIKFFILDFHFPFFFLLISMPDSVSYLSRWNAILVTLRVWENFVLGDHHFLDSFKRILGLERSLSFIVNLRCWRSRVIVLNGIVEERAIRISHEIDHWGLKSHRLFIKGSIMNFIPKNFVAVLIHRVWKLLAFDMTLVPTISA